MKIIFNILCLVRWFLFQLANRAELGRPKTLNMSSRKSYVSKMQYIFLDPYWFLRLLLSINDLLPQSQKLISLRVDRCDSKDKDKDKIAEIWWNKSTSYKDKDKIAEIWWKKSTSWSSQVHTQYFANMLLYGNFIPRHWFYQIFSWFALSKSPSPHPLSSLKCSVGGVKGWEADQRQQNGFFSCSW